MEMYIHKGRNVVVKRGENGDKWDVAFVGVADSVDGQKRRGRHPNYWKNPVKATELVVFESPSSEWTRKAEMALVRPLDIVTDDAPQMASEPDAD